MTAVTATTSTTTPVLTPLDFGLIQGIKNDPSVVSTKLCTYEEQCEDVTPSVPIRVEMTEQYVDDATVNRLIRKTAITLYRGTRALHYQRGANAALFVEWASRHHPALYARARHIVKLGLDPTLVRVREHNKAQEIQARIKIREMKSHLCK